MAIRALPRGPGSDPVPEDCMRLDTTPTVPIEQELDHVGA